MGFGSAGFFGVVAGPVVAGFGAALGVDFGAPTGTPVQAASDGVVIRAGWAGGYGNTVELRHANGFQTLYGHLSRIGVRAGQRVTQGEWIGNVGSTGLSTGPHLDYRMRRDGVFVNPLTVALPPAEPVAAAERAAFETVAARAVASPAPTWRSRPSARAARWSRPPTVCASRRTAASRSCSANQRTHPEPIRGAPKGAPLFLSRKTCPQRRQP